MYVCMDFIRRCNLSAESSTLCTSHPLPCGLLLLIGGGLTVTGQLGPDALPRVGEELLAGDCAARELLDRGGVGDGHRLFAVHHAVGIRSGDAEVPRQRSDAPSLRFGPVLEFVHGRHLTPR